MNYTQNYQLPQWEKTDRIMMDDFNAAMVNLETGLTGKAEIMMGTYTGDGAETRTITLGFQPKALYTCSQGGLSGYIEGYYYTWGGLVLPGHPLVDQGHNNEIAIELTATGFRLYRDDYRRINEKGCVYFYWLLR